MERLDCLNDLSAGDQGRDSERGSVHSEKCDLAGLQDGQTASQVFETFIDAGSNQAHRAERCDPGYH